MILDFRHLPCVSFFQAVGKRLQTQGLHIARSIFVNARIIIAPGSALEQEKVRDPQVHQTKAGNQCYFGMKAHAGVTKCVFGFTRVCYRGLAKNAHALFVLYALTNEYLAHRRCCCQSQG